jgi:hypothetical protein
MVNGSTTLVLRPPSNFQSVYQGKSRTTAPIPFVVEDVNREFLAADPLAGNADVASNLGRAVAVPIGSSALIIIPKAFYADGSNLRTQAYRYDFRWRLRSIADNASMVQKGQPVMPFSSMTTTGAPSSPAPTSRRVIPAYTTEEVTPAATGIDGRPLIDAATVATVSQGIYNADDFAAVAPGGDVALGVTYFPPYLRPIVGNELSIVASMATGTWNFTDTTDTGDAAFSNVYGTNIAGPSHPPYPGVGILLVILDRNTTP